MHWPVNPGRYVQLYQDSKGPLIRPMRRAKISNKIRYLSQYENFLGI